MKSEHDLHNHNHYHYHYYAEELLEDYALGTLSAENTEWVRQHLESCTSCQHTLAPMMAVTQALAFATPDPDVPMSDDLWGRIEHAISQPGTRAAAPDTSPSNIHPLPLPLPLSPPPPRIRPRQWLTVAALMVLSLIGGTLLGQVLPQFSNEDEITGQQIAIEFTDPNIAASGVLRYLPDQQVFVLEVDGLAPPPEGFVHQAWLIDEAGPIPAGLMDPERGEVASVGDRDGFQTFAITIEPGPLGNAAPTTEPILVAQLHEANGS